MLEYYSVHGSSTVPSVLLDNASVRTKMPKWIAPSDSNGSVIETPRSDPQGSRSQSVERPDMKLIGFAQ